MGRKEIAKRIVDRVVEETYKYRDSSQWTSYLPEHERLVKAVEEELEKLEKEEKMSVWERMIKKIFKRKEVES